MTKQQQSIHEFNASPERRHNALCIRLTLAAIICAVGVAVCSCRGPDAFDAMFEAAAQQNVLRMQQPMRQTKTWQEWKEAARP